MPNYTTNLNLEKPLADEQYNVNVFNANADKIDQFAGQVPPRALTSDKLSSPIKINGINFDGSKDVVTGYGLYSDDVTYNTNNIAFKVINNEVIQFKSLVDLNKGNDPENSPEYWELQGAVNNNLSNLSETGEKHFLGKRQLSNCITEVPQRIKYTLNGGLLTLKAGSIIIVPYGTVDLSADYNIGDTFINSNFKVYDTDYEDGKFFVLAQLQADISNSSTGYTSVTERYIAIDITTNSLVTFGNGMSGTTGYSGDANVLLYRTDTNYVRRYNSGTLTNDVICLPLFKIENDATNLYAKINQIFNGMGFIGSAYWCDKDIKGLAPTGRNEDGSLKSQEIVTHIRVRTTSTDSRKRGILFGGSDKLSANVAITIGDTPPVSTNYIAWYNTFENQWYYKNANSTTWTKMNKFYVGWLYSDDTSITDLQFNSSVQVAEDISRVSKTGDTMTGSLNITYGSLDVSPLSSNSIAIHHKDYTKGQTPSANIFRTIGFFDDGGTNNEENRMAVVEHRVGADSSNMIYIRATKNEAGSATTAGVEVGFDSNGNSFCNFPKCTTQPTTISSASNGKVAVVVQNYKSGNSWYRVWSDGWIEQGGIISGNGSLSSVSVSLLKSHSNTNYSIMLSTADVSDTTVNGAEIAWGFKTTSSFKVGRQNGYSGTQQLCWMTVGF